MQKKWKKLLRQAAPYTKKNHRRRIWQKIVQFMACIVVFCTTYALILPAITMERTYCGMEEHTHSDACYTQSEESPDTLTCGLVESPGHEHSDGCYNENGELVCTEQLEAHAHTERCYGTWTLTCTLEEHTHNTDCTTLLALSEEDRAEVEAVIAMIDQLPSYEEMEATLLAYEEAEDLEGYEAYYTEIGIQGRTAYDAYEALTAEQQACVTNIDKLMELSSVWSAVTLEASSVTGGITAYARDTINCTNTSGKIRPILVYGYVLNHFGENATDPNTLWMAINVNESVTGRLYVDYISGYAPLANFMGWEPQYEDRDGDGIKEGFVLLTPVDYANEKKSLAMSALAIW